MSKDVVSFDDFGDLFRHSMWLKLCDFMWHCGIIVLVVIAMFTAGVHIFLSTAIQLYMLNIAFQTAEANHDKRMEDWIERNVERFI